MNTTPPPGTPASLGALPPPPESPSSKEPEPDADEMHRRAVALRDFRQGKAPHPGRNPATGASRDGTWVSPGYRSSSLRARVAISLVAATVVADVVGTLLDLQGGGLMDAAAAGLLDAEEAAAFDAVYGLVGLAQLAVYVASAIALLAWLSRVVDNIPPLTGRVPRRSPREAIGWWFVPFANYVVPYQIVGDTLRRLRTDGGGIAGSLLLVWWIAWVLGNLAGSALWRLPQDTIDEIRLTFALSAIGDVTTAVAGVLLIVIIRAIEQGADGRAASLVPGPVAAPAWSPITQAQSVSTTAADGHGPLAPPPPPLPPDA